MKYIGYYIERKGKTGTVFRVLVVDAQLGHTLNLH